MRTRLLACTVSLTLLAACTMAGGRASSTNSRTADMPTSEGPAVAAPTVEQAGEYLTIVGSCNDCHTQGWAETKGNVSPADRFAGMNVGFRGSWGTSYGKNLRTITQRQSEERWVQTLRTSDDGDGKPPMPWWNTKQMSDRDLRAMYRYIKSLGPKPNGVPRALPPGKEPTGPYIWVEPQPAK